MASTQLQVPGAILDILDEGPRDGPIVLLSHALMASLTMWDSTVHALHSSGYRTIRYNHVGHGGSAPPTTSTFHFDDFTTHLRLVLAAAAGPDAAAHAVVGCSMGGVLAVRFGQLHPSLVRRIVCCDAPGLTALEASKPKWRARMAQFADEGVAGLGAATVERWFPDPVAAGVKEKARRMVEGCSLAGYCACARGIMDYDYDAELPGLAVPTMVLVGDKDEAVGPYEVLERVAARIPGAEYVRLKDCGHIPAMHQPEDFERTLLAFLK